MLKKELMLKIIALVMVTGGTMITEVMKISKIDHIESDIYNKVLNDVMKNLEKEEVI